MVCKETIIFKTQNTVSCFQREVAFCCMKKGITKKKFCISIDIELYERIEKLCDETDAKISTKINSLLSEALKKRGK